jgi:ATPase family AAA domain-containing protein 1
MTLWDGLTSSNASGVPARILVLGATNRIHDIDAAILRRMPKKFPVPLPGNDQRRRILQLILQDTKTDPSHFDLEYITKVTAGMSGSDIKEACRDAAMAPVREYMREHRANGNSMLSVNPDQFRGIRTEDFFGQKGGGQILMENHTTLSAKTSGNKFTRSQSDEYEDIEEEIIPEQPD